MKRLILAISAGLLSVAIFALGFAAGTYLYDYDVLCEREYSAHKLTKEFHSQEGVILPAETIIYARACKPNTDVRLEFYIDNWNYQNIERLEGDPRPVYYLDIKDEEE